VAEDADLKPSPAPTSTTVLWDRVVGAQLEELLYGLLDVLGAKELAWRAGTVQGVTAADGGRDIEAVFDRPTPDGELERQRWWVESKGRQVTVDKRDVIAAVHEAAGRDGLDVFVFCTNSRFTNPTRDWVTEWQAAHPRPKIRLWDRDHLARMVRQHPTVAARVLPDALDDVQRLELLLDRFRSLGETPALPDLEYFWVHPDVVGALDQVEDRVGAIAMFAYTEGDEGLVERPWATLIGTDPGEVRTAVLEAAIGLPLLQIRPLSRPLDGVRNTATSAYLVLAVMHQLEAAELFEMLHSPGDFVEGQFAATFAKPSGAAAWRQITSAVVQRIQAELEDVCGADCRRVDAEPNVFPSHLVGKRYWRRFGLGEPPEDRRLIIESYREPCVVGLDVNENRSCPLLAEPELTLERVTELQRITLFRRANPEGPIPIRAATVTGQRSEQGPTG